MRSHQACLLFLASCAITTACSRGSPEEASPVLPDSYRPLPDVATPLWVEPGSAWVGAIGFDYVTGNLVPYECPEQDLAHGWLVAGFFLDVDEVRGKDYDACVSAGACEFIAMAPDLPATLSAAELGAYCRFRGGRLPLASEIARASAGDDFGLTTERFFREWLACDDIFWQSEACDSLAWRAAPFALGAKERRGILPIRSDPRDVGPYGHWDLYGSQAEYTATFSYASVSWCSFPSWFFEPPTEPNTYGEAIRFIHAPAWGFASRTPLRNPFRDVIGYWVFRNSSPLGSHGGRCAYDAEWKLAADLEG